MAKSIVPFNYNEIYQGIAKKFLDAGYDIPYEGSNVAVLTSAMAYAIQALNFNTAMNINESLLPLNKKRENAVQNARILSYEPKHRISNQLKLFIRPKKAGYIEIKKYQEFKINGYSYYYFGDDIARQFEDKELSSATIEIKVKEGTLLKYEDYEDVLVYSLEESAQYIDIPFDDVEDDGLIVTVDVYDDVGNKTEGVSYSKKSFNMQDSADVVENAYYRKDDIETSNCRIYFKLGGLGKTLKEGSKIYVNVLRSNGSAPNSNTFSASISGNLAQSAEILNSGEYVITNYITGQDEETIESIQERAPLFFNTAGRCITAADYKTFLASQNAIYEGIAWGGEDELVAQVGRVYFSAIPQLTEPEFETQSATDAEVDISEEIEYEENEDGSKSYETIPTESQIEWVTTADANEVDVFRKTNYKNNLFMADGDYVSAINYIKEYAPPSLLNYVKNPVYIFADVNFSIKKYEYGANKSQVHQKIYDCVKAYFDARKGFGVNFVESTLSKQISEILGENNGFMMDTLFSLYLSSDNKVMQVSKDFDYNSDIVTYKPVYSASTNTLSITAYLNSKSTAGDVIRFALNHPATDGLQDPDTGAENRKLSVAEVYVTTQDVARGDVTLSLQELTTLDLNVMWRSSISSDTKTADEIPITFKNLYYSTEIRNDVFHLSACLPSNVKEGDKYVIYGVKGDVLNPLTYSKDDDKLVTYGGKGSSYEKLVTFEQITAGKITVDLVLPIKEREEGADIDAENLSLPDDLSIRLATSTSTMDGTSTYDFELSPVKCDTYDAAELAQQNDESSLYDELSGKEAFFVSNILQRKNNNYKVTMYLPSNFIAGDKIEINYGGVTTTYELTTNDIQNYKAVYELALEELDVSSVSYTSVNEVTMTIMRYGTYSNDSLIPLSDDRIQYSGSAANTNYIEYTPITSSGGQIALISGDNINVSFYRNYDNSFDLRNMIVNFGAINGDDAVNYDADNGTHKKISQWQVTVVNGEGVNAYCNYEDESDDRWVLHCENPQRTTYVDVSLSLMRAGGEYEEDKTYFSHFRINIIDVDSSTETLAEGAGGIFINLDLPPEGIYGDDGDINYDNLPRIYALGVQKSRTDKNGSIVDSTIYNLSTMGQETNTVLSRANTNLNKMIYVDFDTTKNEIIEGMYPYFISRTIAESQADSTYKWIRFPIKYSTGSTDETIIGTYIIVNDTNPYIRIKFKNEVIGLLGTDLELEFVYPSNNFVTIKNCALRLRSVNIAHLGENYAVRQEIKDQRDTVTQDLFSSWAVAYNG